MKPQLHILLLRHGLTEANAGGVIQGHQPTPLSETGHAQAAQLAERLRLWRPRLDLLISSDLRRALQTAEPIAQALDLPVVPDPAWRERRMGEMEGKTVGERETWRAATGDSDPPGAEAVTEFYPRMRGALLGLCQHAPKYRCIGVVTHGGCCLAILRMLANGTLHLDPATPIRDPRMVHNCSILHLTVAHVHDEPVWAVQCINDAAHLSESCSADAG